MSITTSARNLTTLDGERRRSDQYRQVFEFAYDRVEAFIDPANSWAGQPLEHMAYNVLREQFPQVSEEELQAFFSAAKRVFGERNTLH